jgi:hypothetical protein
MAASIQNLLEQGQAHDRALTAHSPPHSHHEREASTDDTASDGCPSPDHKKQKLNFLESLPKMVMGPRENNGLPGIAPVRNPPIEFFDIPREHDDRLPLRQADSPTPTQLSPTDHHSVGSTIIEFFSLTSPPRPEISPDPPTFPLYQIPRCNPIYPWRRTMPGLTER